MAQLLDYASWVKDLGHEQVLQIAESYLKQPLAEVFQKRFGRELPDSINEQHRLLLVGSEVDSGTERIVEYLSETYSVPINVATFQYFKDDASSEHLARIFLISEESELHRISSRSSSKRRPTLSYSDLEAVSAENGVAELYVSAVKNLAPFFEATATTASSIAFIQADPATKARTTLFHIKPKKSSPEVGLRCTIYTDRFAKYFGLTKEQVIGLFAKYNVKEGSTWAGEEARAYIGDSKALDLFISKLRQAKSR